MTQKDKVKELVGRGLNSYHTKSLQQMDRIEKKNKEQNHKISILSNELDNDYLTKTEEGSVISLEHSKEGMVYLDELQGNTLVNYCTDGSKEMTLNGDIDVEGTFVTTTEGVDNGKVDVMCEGNTLVNLKYGSGGNDCNIAWADSGTIEYFNRQEYSKIHCKGEIVETANNLGISWIYHIMGQVKLHLLKPNTTYTIKLNNKYDCITSILIQAGNATNSYVKSYQKIDKDTYLIITKDSFEELSTNGIILYGTLSKDYKGSVDYKIIGMFEGDWSNKELPNDFFEGMKSVGQDNENGHKIEILSQCNLADIATSGNTNFNVANIKAGKTYSIKSTRNDSSVGYNLLLQKNDGTNLQTLVGGAYGDFYTFTPNQDGILHFNSYKGNTLVTDIMLVEGVYTQNTIPSFKPYQYNKKEILMNEPLRGFEDGKKDRFIKICGKWYIERNCQLKSSSQFTWLESGRQFENHYCVYVNGLGGKTDSKFLSTSYPYIANAYANKLDASYISNNSSSGYDLITLTIPKSKLTTVDIIGAREYLNNNPFDFMIELATPKYEEITEPILTTYLDITHISNNSIIPCNMKIKNSGYNAIIKPSTLYTVALDTNKSGTIGVNLGGAKGTTTNNVLKLTTPATLTDDSLRLYGKGIKGSKVRLLEGDKTNWIPSHFEGMKSSFEDKFDVTDNTYKMEILSNNKNLINIKDYNKNTWGINISYSQGQIVLNGTLTGKDDGLSDYYLVGGWDTEGDNLNLKPNTRYTFSGNIPNGVEVYIIHKAKVLCGINSGNKIATWTNGSIRDVNALMVRVREGHTFSNTKVNIQIEEGSTSTTFVNNIYNKIQFSSIEPLRGVDNIKDKFVFKDGRLMIERNCSKYTTVGTENWIRHDYSNSNKIFAYAHVTSMNDRKAYTNIYCNNFATYLKSAEELKNQNNEYIWKGNASHSTLWLWISNNKFDGVSDINKFKTWVKNNPITVTYQLAEPTYEEIPFELQKIILEGYENGTLFFDTNIPPTSTVTYAGEIPIVKAAKLNKTEVLNNTNDINDNIIPYLMDMDYRVVCLQLQSEEFNGGVAMARLFGGAYEMLKRDILSKRLTREEYGHRLADYFNAGKLTEEQVRELEDLR